MEVPDASRPPAVKARAEAMLAVYDIIAALPPADQVLIANDVCITWGQHPSRRASKPPLKSTSPPSSKSFKATVEGLQNGDLNSGVSSFFLQFWVEYPRRQGKQEAFQKLLKLQPNQELQDRILVALREQKTWDGWTRDGGRFIPLPSTWLHQRRWEDEVTTSKGTSKASRVWMKGSEA